MRSKKGKSIEQRLEELTKNEVGYNDCDKNSYSYVITSGTIWEIKVATY